MVPEA
jgi:hypothetical protein